MLCLITKVIIKNKNGQTSTKHATMFGGLFCVIFDVMFGVLFGGVFGGEIGGILFFAYKYQAISIIIIMLSLGFCKAFKDCILFVFIFNI